MCFDAQASSARTSLSVTHKDRPKVYDVLYEKCKIVNVYFLYVVSTLQTMVV